MTAVWPDCSAATTPGVTVRDRLDYVVWIAEAMEPVGFHATEEVERWRPRVDRAYLSLIDSMAPGHGDPLPPDVPPSIRPGTWPDVPSATIPGMTVRHQLTVIRTVAAASRTSRSFPRQPADVAAWTARVLTAYEALDHGPALAMPPEARTQPPPPPPPRKKAGAKQKGPVARAAARIQTPKPPKGSKPSASARKKTPAAKRKAPPRKPASKGPKKKKRR